MAAKYAHLCKNILCAGIYLFSSASNTIITSDDAGLRTQDFKSYRIVD
jgi:hypothetical protein